MAKLWHGRFEGETAAFADEWGASISFDKRLARFDILGSVAHCRMLAGQGILSAEDAGRIEEGLCGILAEVASGALVLGDGYEDVHMAVESILTERIGEAGKRLHTARSRNDQVATDTMLWMREEIRGDLALLHGLRTALVARAREEADTVLPGCTHLQHAQPVRLGFHLMAYERMFARDMARLRLCHDCVSDRSPLGAGALAGVSYGTDREGLARALGFRLPSENAMDTVSNRDHVVEYISAAAILMMHLSRFCEELILWNSSEYGFVVMDDAYSTGSSIMPQKKNPDMAELIRGKTGRVYGDLMGILTVMKGLPLAYNKDMQEDKIPLFDAADTVRGCLVVFTEMFRTLRFVRGRMEDAARAGFMNATDAADYLVGKGVPFRECHEIVGRLVLYCEKEGCSLEDVPLEKLQAFSPCFGEDVYARIAPRACMDAKASLGSTSGAMLARQIADAEAELAAGVPFADEPGIEQLLGVAAQPEGGAAL